MDRLATALEPGQLYDYREGDPETGRPPVFLPHFQADIFENVELPGIQQEKERLAMLFMHPCTMRQGAKIRPVVTAIAVRQHPDPSVLKDAEKWDAWYKGMPLPDLRGDGIPYSGDFMSLASMSGAELDRSKRIASLSLAGRVRFQQRIIFHLTRFAPDIPTLEASTRNVEFELEMQTEWLDAKFTGTSPTEDEVAEMEAAFDGYMKAGPSFTSLNSGQPIPTGTTRRGLLALGCTSELVSELSTILEK